MPAEKLFRWFSVLRLDFYHNAPIIATKTVAKVGLTPNTAKTDGNIRSRINKTRMVVNVPAKIWSSKHISTPKYACLTLSEAGDAVQIRDMEKYKTHNEQAANIHEQPESGEH